MATSFSYGHIRTWGNPAVGWSDTQPTKGSYVGDGSRHDRDNMEFSWDAMDSYISLAEEAGIDIVLPLCWPTPTWAATSIANPDGWGRYGGASPVSNLQFVRDYAFKVAEHVQDKEVTIYFEGRNEPNLEWEGSTEDLVAEMAAIQEGAIEAGYTGKIIGPSYTKIDRLELYLQAASGTATGYSTCDWLNLHPYGHGPNKAMAGSDLYWGPNGLLPLKRLLTKLNLPQKPVCCTEFGISNTVNDPRMQKFYSLSGADRKAYVMRILAMALGEGWQFFNLFTYWNPNENPGGSPGSPTPGGSLIGDYRNDPYVKAGLTDFKAATAGKTLRRCGWYEGDGAVFLAFSDGTSYVW